MKRAPVSVVIITKNRSKQLKRCLRSLVNQSKKPAETIIIDSSDIPMKLRRGEAGGLRVFYLHKPHYSIPQARREGVEKAKHARILFLDDDCTAEKRWIEKMMGLSARHSQAMLIASSLIHLPRSSVYAQIIESIREKRFRLAGSQKYLYFNIENCLLRKNLLRRHKIQFDETMHHEEFADLALQIHKVGGEIIISEATRVHHFERTNLGSFLRQRFKNSGNLARLKRKWPRRRFHFFASQGRRFADTFWTTIFTFISQRQLREGLEYLGIIILSVIVYDFGNFYYRLRYHEGINQKYLRVKPALDLILAFILFVISLPIMMLIGLIVRLDSPGPIIFSQMRVGKNLKPFRFYKFRTMWADAKQRFPELYKYKITADKLDSFKFKTIDDPRFSRFGKYLRKTSLDELPNLFNVVRGEMSLVGPRPEIPQMLPHYTKEEKLKFSVKPGITGYAQIKGRGLSTFKQTINHDLNYVREQGLLTDIETIAGTIYSVLRGLGAF